jgi:hypothetical protein
LSGEEARDGEDMHLPSRFDRLAQARPADQPDPRAGPRGLDRPSSPTA